MTNEGQLAIDVKSRSLVKEVFLEGVMGLVKETIRGVVATCDSIQVMGLGTKMLE